MSKAYPLGGKGGIQSDLMTSPFEDVRRLKVDVDDTSYVLGTQFRISHPLVVTNTAPVTLRFTSPIDFELVSQSLSTHESGISFEAFRDIQGAPTGIFDATVPTYKNNSQSTANDYLSQISVDTGGGFTPNVGQTAVETLNVLSASATAQKASSFAGVSGKRGLPAGTYYLRFSKLGGAGESLGVYALIFNEKP
jgi:hypothetical protein